jgi:DNA polymerase III epsilon subunit-like protein
MLALVFDTETTGLLNRRAPLNDPSQPGIVQLCAEFSLDGKLVSGVNLFIHGEQPVEEKAFETHRISRDLTASVGITERQMCQLFIQMVSKADVLVGHNIEFDIQMILATMLRLGGTGELLRSKPIFCTMKQSTEVLKIPHPSRGGFKYPSLTEAYKALVDPRGFENAHDARADVLACHGVYNALKNRNL